MNQLMILGSRLFESVLQASWQSAVLVVLIILAQFAFRKKLSAGWRHGLWLLLVARLLLPAWPQSAFSIFNVAKLQKAPAKPGDSPTASSQFDLSHSPAQNDKIEKNEATVSALPPSSQEAGLIVSTPLAQAPSPKSSERPLAQRSDWFAAAFTAWVVGICLLGFRLIWTNFRFQARLSHYVPVRNAEALQVLQECIDILKIRQRINLIETDEVESPAVYGLFRKRLLLPETILERFPREEIRYIFLHELAHLKRRDLELNWVVGLLQLVHWFNPIIWFAFSRMRADRELATDALVLASVESNESRRYGETILRVIERLTGPRALPNLVGIVESKTHIGNRLREIVRYGSTKPWRWGGLGIALVLAGLALTDARESKHAAVSKTSPGTPASLAASSARTIHSAEASRHFELRTLDYDTSIPLAQATISFELKDYSGHFIQRELVTQPDGIASLELPNSELKSFSYHVVKCGYLPLHGEWLNQEISRVPEKFQIRLSTGIEIGGKVVDGSDWPVKDAEIFFDHPMNLLLSNSPSSVIWSAKEGIALARTDVQGMWKTKCIWPTARWAALRVRHSDFADAVFSTEVTKAMEAKSKDHHVEFEDLRNHQGKFALEKGNEVQGRVVDESGSGIAGVQVRYADRPSENPFWDHVMGTGVVKTDSKGDFHINHVPPKQIYFTIQKPGFAPVAGNLDGANSKSTIELRLEKGRKLSGQVKDINDVPISQARLSFQDWSQWQGVRWEAVTDSDGRFQWEDAPADNFQVAIEKEGYISQRKILQSNTNQSIRLNPALKITGNVLDAKTRRPIERFKIVWAGGEHYLDYPSRYPVWGSNGVYSLDLGKLNAEPWAGGYAHEFMFRIEADGYVPTKSRNFSSRNGDVGAVGYDIELTPAPMIVGTVTGPAGQLLAGAQVILRTPNSKPRLNGKPQFENLQPGDFQLTDDKGRFRITADPQASHLLAVHERGFAMLEVKGLTTNSILQLQRWGKIDATVWEYDAKIVNQEVSLGGRVFDEAPPWSPVIGWNATTDEQGRCSFSYVPPVKCVLYRLIPNHQGGWSGGPQHLLQVRSGEITPVKIGGIGRPIIGKFKIKNPYVQIDWQSDKDNYWVSTVLPRPSEDVKTSEDYNQWRQQKDIQAAFDKFRNHHIQFSVDGSFRIDEMVPGKYNFNIEIHDPRDPDAFAMSHYIARFHETFEVPESKEQNSRVPFDAGTFEVALIPQVEEGKTSAPDFEALGLMDKKFKLSDFRGKYVLLDFWSTWCGPCVAEIPNLRKVNDEFKSRSDFVMLSVSLDQKLDTWRSFLKTNNMPWLQGTFAESSGPNVPEQYGVQGIPALFIINPEGKIVATDLQGSEVRSRLQRLLK